MASVIRATKEKCMVCPQSLMAEVGVCTQWAWPVATRLLDLPKRQFGEEL